MDVCPPTCSDYAHNNGQTRSTRRLRLVANAREQRTRPEPCWFTGNAPAEMQGCYPSVSQPLGTSPSKPPLPLRCVFENSPASSAVCVRFAGSFYSLVVLRLGFLGLCAVLWTVHPELIRSLLLLWYGWISQCVHSVLIPSLHAASLFCHSQEVHEVSFFFFSRLGCNDSRRITPILVSL